jgi:hypothetical protein
MTRKTLPLVCFLLMLAVGIPAQAQLREEVRSSQSPVRLYSTNEATQLLNRLFDPNHFRMGHSIEFSTSSFGSLGMYTNTMQWQFSQKLAARLDVSAAYSPMGDDASKFTGGASNSPRVFVQNAELAWRPSSRTTLHLSFRQSPYGAYVGPYGYYGPAYGGGLFNATVGNTPRDLFWRDDVR